MGGGAQGIGPGAMSANLFASAVEHFYGGRHDEAERLCRDVLMFNKGHFDAQHMLAVIAGRAGNLDAAAELYGRALAINGRNPDCHFNLSQVLRAQGRNRDAMEHLGAAIALKADYAEAIGNLGIIHAEQGHFAAAIEHYQRAISIKPQLVDVYSDLCRALLADGRVNEALAAVIQGLAIGETDEAKALFIQCAQSLANVPPGDAFRDLIIRALTEGWGRPAALSSLAAFMFILSASGAAAIERVLSAAPVGDVMGLLAGLADDRLLRALLESASVRNITVERFLTAVRSLLLQAAAQTDAASASDSAALTTASALARQCFINEYAFAEADIDLSQLAGLRERVALALSTGAPVSPMALLAIACFTPLHSLPHAPALLQRPWPEAVTAVLVQQVQEPATEREIAATLPTLTAIDNAVSVQVREQYEDMPYPRWVRTSSIGQPYAIDWWLRRQFPNVAIQPTQRAETLDVLIAGCGTGQHAIETAQRFAGARVLAIDLSRASLAYAARKSREAGVRNIEYRQADILNLGSLDASFDLIEASGVLHHMGDPRQGWRTLLPLLRPNGVMNIGLYSALARADVRTTRALIAERGYTGTANDIRRCRQELLSYADGTPFKNATRYDDFFTIGECRDLLFHVQEHQFTIPEIKDFLAESPLRFLGFAGPVTRAYRNRFPEDRTLTDLDRWHLFETENPMAFVNMYQFWVQKRAS
jgi:SAM-dependent methyltransferase/Tfp pilus assembly protein PilF